MWGTSLLPDRLLLGVKYGSALDAAGVRNGFDCVDAAEEVGTVLAVEFPRTRVLTDNDGGARLLLLSFSMATMAIW